MTEKQRLYAEARFSGMSKKESAIAAGCPAKNACQSARQLDCHPNVLAHIARLKKNESESNPAAGKDPSPIVQAPFFDDPKDMLKHAMNDPMLDYKTRLDAAKSLLPYEHSKVGETGKKENQDKAAGEVVKGRFKQAPPPQMRLV